MSSGGDPEPSEAVEPAVIDSDGYCLTYSDLNFVHIESSAFERLTSLRAPLGMDEDEYAFFTDTLHRALLLDGIEECDLRLKGSSVNLFSGTHKRIPWTRDALFDLFSKRRGRVPLEIELQGIERRLKGQWPSRARRPTNPIFDLFYSIRLDRNKSDFDVQLSSDEIDRRATDRLVELGVTPANHRIIHPTYNFIDKKLFEYVCGHLTLWAAHCGEVLDRNVTIAAFPSEGPPDRSEAIGALSSHFQHSDWIISGGPNGTV